MNRVVFTAAMLLGAGGACFAQDFAINAPGSPVELSNLQTQFLPRDEEGSGPSFVFRADAKNVSSGEVLAYSIGFIAIDAVGDQVGPDHLTLNILAVAPSETRKDVWAISDASAASLERYGSGIAFVRRARLADGTIWRADEQTIQRLSATYLSPSR